MLHEIEITNINRKRRWGWGFSTTPSGNGPYSIELPTAPDYVGTIGQISEAIASDVVFHSLGGAFYATQDFWDGHPIVATWRFGCLQLDRGHWEEEADGDGVEWVHDEDAKYGYAWFDGLEFPENGSTTIKIRVEMEE